MVYALLLLSGLFGAIGELGLYKWAKTDSIAWIVGAFVSWAISLGLFGLLLRMDQRSLSVLFVLSAAVHIIIVVGWDRVCEASRLSTWEGLGVVFGIVAILLIQLGEHKEVNSPQMPKTLAQQMTSLDK